MLMKEEQFHLMEFHRFFDCVHQNLHHLLIHIFSGPQEHRIDQSCDLEGIVPQAGDEELDELLMDDIIFLSLNELLIKIFFTIHLEDIVNIIRWHQESLSVVECNSRFNGIVDDDDLIIGWSVLSVTCTFQDWDLLFWTKVLEELEVDLRDISFEG